jgi:hypothetical protein
MAKKRAKSKLKKKKLPPQNLKVGVDIAFESLANGDSYEQAVVDVKKHREELKLPAGTLILSAIVNEAKRQLVGNHTKESGQVIAIHVERYNKDILEMIEQENPFELNQDEFNVWVMEHGCEELDLSRVKNRLNNCYFQALASMYQKEKVLKMHSKNFLVNIVNKFNIDLEKEEKREYDLSALSGDEKTDFLNLIIKAKKNDFEVGSVILRPPEQQSETIDIAHEVIEESVNVDKIKHEEIPIAAPPRNGTAVMDVRSKLEQALKKKAEEDFRNVGSKNV